MIIGFAPLFVPMIMFATFGLFLSGIIVMIFGEFMPARTLKGVDELLYLRGLKMYMELAEKDRIKTLQSVKRISKNQN